MVCSDRSSRCIGARNGFQLITAGTMVITASAADTTPMARKTPNSRISGTWLVSSERNPMLVVSALSPTVPRISRTAPATAAA
jgi:hypothetical protein